MSSGRMGRGSRDGKGTTGERRRRKQKQSRARKSMEKERGMDRTREGREEGSVSKASGDINPQE